MLAQALRSRLVQGASAQPQVKAGQAPLTKKYLFGPIVDFLCLGGTSLLLLPFLFLLPEQEYRVPLAAAMLLVAHLINHPHFAHSYQIFYRGYSAKVFRASLGRTMQVRYLIAGIVVPLVLISFCVFGIVTRDAQLLGYGANIMALSVGWHYVKQGYGMLMVDAALKRRFFNDRAKKVFLVNCYVVWGAAWMYFNAAVSKNELWGIYYYTFAIPQPLVMIGGIAACMAGAATLYVLFSHWKEKGSLPANGVMAYLVSLYLWLLFVRVDPLWVLVVPALHSIQYMTVVWRYQTNYEKAQLATPEYKKNSLARQVFGDNHYGHMAVFVLTAAVLGFLGFWALPIMATAAIPYDQQALTGTLFLFVAWMCINVHHYFLDNVMWRRENPDTKQYLFG